MKPMLIFCAIIFTLSFNACCNRLETREETIKIEFLLEAPKDILSVALDNEQVTPKGYKWIKYKNVKELVGVKSIWDIDDIKDCYMEYNSDVKSYKVFFIFKSMDATSILVNKDERALFLVIGESLCVRGLPRVTTPISELVFAGPSLTKEEAETIVKAVNSHGGRGRTDH
ncbi:MAG: hypothetical protein WC980_08680 [Candidatus Brocadiia bacterium]